MRCRLATLAVASVLLAAACGDDDATPTTAPTTTAATSTTVETTTTTVTETGAATRPLAEIALALEPVGDFDVPTAYRVHPDGTGWVAEKPGRVRSFETGDVALDIVDSVRDQSEQGFLGIEFSADGTALYTSYTNRSGTSIVDEYPFAGGRADVDGRREVLRIEQPYANHNGGDLHLGPDGYLYATFGDGGSSGDPEGNAQDPSTLLGTILRIDPTAPEGDRAYGIPGDNPFADGGGLPEIYLYGARNPWRMAFDPDTEDLWVADVGQDAWEEINWLPAADGSGLGANLGWPRFEGTHLYDESTEVTDAVAPVHEYGHEGGACSITGGFVYRGAAIPGLDGAYFFADLCLPELRAIRVEGGQVTDERRWDLDVPGVTSFGVDPDGELLVLTQRGAIHRVVAG